MDNYRWHFRIWQDDMVVAQGSAEHRGNMLREMGHYAAVYSQDGPVRVQTRTGKNRWKDHQP